MLRSAALLASALAVVAAGARLAEPPAAPGAVVEHHHLHGFEGPEPALPTQCEERGALELCGPEVVDVGEPVALGLTAHGDCGSPLVDFGDGSPVEPWELGSAVGHVYERAGALEVAFAVPGCGRIGLAVVVEA